jgi:hypothetical protein
VGYPAKFILRLIAMPSNHKALEKPLERFHALADNYLTINPIKSSFWRVFIGGYPYTSRDIVRLSMKYSIAAERDTQKPIRRFVRRYRRDAHYIVGMEASVLQKVLQEYMSRLDQIFFFSLLMRRVKRRGLLLPPEPLVELKIRQGHNKELVAYWSHIGCRITMYKQREARSGLQSEICDFHLDELLATLAHEMVHAYLDIFSNRRDKEHKENVDAQEGHGRMFWRLYYFVMEMLAHWIPDSEHFGAEVVEREEADNCCP